jgi:V8-like Glu-specific endopeptidase
MALDVLQWRLWPMVGMVLSYFPSLRSLAYPYTVGSATLINSQFVLTAAHVIYDPTRGGQADAFDVYFGDGSSHRGLSGLLGKVRTDWKSAGTLDPLSMIDAGVIQLDRSASPQPAVPLSTTLYDLMGVPINVIGIAAGDDAACPNYGALMGTRTSAYNMGPPYNGYRVGYLNYTCDGMSGGPVLRVDEINNGSFVVRAVHTSLWNNMGNGLMLYQSLLDQVNRWLSGLL